MALVIFAFFIAALARPRPASMPGNFGKAGRTGRPAADEPTPDRSVTAKAREIANARRHAPPA